MSIAVSVIMPVLNGMPYFEKALESVLNQSMQNIEVLVVDANSTDGTKEFVTMKMQQDSRVKLLTSKKKSMGHQYNIGIENAQGEYVAFCESDDYFDSDMLLRCYEVAKKNSELEFVKSDFQMFIGYAENTCSIEYKILPSTYRKYYNQIVSLKDVPVLLFRDVNMWNGIYKTSFVKEKEIVLNETKGAAFQDTDFVEQVLLSAKYGCYICIDSYHYRRDNLGSSVYKDTAIFVLQELRYMIGYLNNNKKIAEDFGELIIDRLFPFFCDRYGRKLYLQLDGELKNDLSELRLEMSKYLKCLSEAQREHILRNELMELFLDGNELFDVLCEMHYCQNKKIIRRFRDIISVSKEVVIFSSGELGTSCCAFLHANHYNGKIVFCDNNSNLHEKVLMNSSVYSVKKVVDLYNSALYIIPNSSMLLDAQTQLTGLGIKRSQIVECPMLGVHSSMEINWNE